MRPIHVHGGVRTPRQRAVCLKRSIAVRASMSRAPGSRQMRLAQGPVALLAGKCILSMMLAAVESSPYLHENSRLPNAIVLGPNASKLHRFSLRRPLPRLPSAVMSNRPTWPDWYVYVAAGEL